MYGQNAVMSFGLKVHVIFFYRDVILESVLMCIICQESKLVHYCLGLPFFFFFISHRKTRNAHQQWSMKFSRV